jgi:hypothetical protein
MPDRPHRLRSRQPTVYAAGPFTRKRPASAAIQSRGSAIVVIRSMGWARGEPEHNSVIGPLARERWWIHSHRPRRVRSGNMRSCPRRRWTRSSISWRGSSPSPETLRAPKLGRRAVNFGPALHSASRTIRIGASLDDQGVVSAFVGLRMRGRIRGILGNLAPLPVRRDDQQRATRRTQQPAAGAARPFAHREAVALTPHREQLGPELRGELEHGVSRFPGEHMNLRADLRATANLSREVTEARLHRGVLALCPLEPLIPAFAVLHGLHQDMGQVQLGAGREQPCHQPGGR